MQSNSKLYPLLNLYSVDIEDMKPNIVVCSKIYTVFKRSNKFFYSEFNIERFLPKDTDVGFKNGDYNITIKFNIFNNISYLSLKLLNLTKYLEYNQKESLKYKIQNKIWL